MMILCLFSSKLCVKGSVELPLNHWLNRPSLVERTRIREKKVSLWEGVHLNRGRRPGGGIATVEEITLQGYKVSPIREQTLAILQFHTSGENSPLSIPWFVAEL